jgi:Uma2 family endonuclease
MAANPPIPVEEYLSMEFDGATPEYLDGELSERGLATFGHGKTTARICSLFEGRSGEPMLLAGAAVHVRMGPTKLRVFDVAVMQHPVSGIPDTPPLIDIEVLSPDDRLDKIIDRFADLSAWGVPHLWLVDPKHQCLYVFGRQSLKEVTAWEIPEMNLRITLADLFGAN